MKVCNSIAKVRHSLSECKEKKIGFVPTMGALHEGHLSLVDEARKRSEVVVMSLFVNPTQFSPNEDFAAYPRDFEQDCALAKKRGVDVMFAPTREEIYPPLFSTYVEESKLAKYLCGEFRTGHFRGVCTVVLKLVNIVRPHYLFMGLKDAQQVRLIEHMLEDFHLPSQVVACATVREADGLAMSSRNRYLTELERAKAVLIHQGLSRAKQMYQQGERRAQALIGAAKNIIMSHTLPRIQYLEVVRWRDFSLVTDTLSEKSVLATAVYLNNVRLIDNVILD